MTNLSEEYDVVNSKRNNSKDGYYRPTVSQLFGLTAYTSNRKYTHKFSFFEPYVENPGFGWATSITDSVIVVGSPNASGVSDATGAAYIYNTEGVYLKKLELPDGEELDYFGKAVAVDNDNIVVCAPWDANSELLHVGSAHVYDLEGNNRITLKPPIPVSSEAFGSSVTLCSGTVVVGAPGATASGVAKAGAVYLFNVDGTYIDKLAAPDCVYGDSFGNCVVANNDILYIGAMNTDGGGAVYMFNVDGTYIKKISPTDTVISRDFGSSLAVIGERLIVGDSDAIVAGLKKSGSASIFDTGGNHIKNITSPSPTSYGNFGKAVGILGDQLLVSDKSNRAITFFDKDGNYHSNVITLDGDASSYFGFNITTNGNSFIASDISTDIGGTVYIYQFE